MTNIAPRVVGFTKLLFVYLPGMSLNNMYKRIQECLMYRIWLSLLADLFSVRRTNALNTCGLINNVSNTSVDAHFKHG